MNTIISDLSELFNTNYFKNRMRSCKTLKERYEVISDAIEFYFLTRNYKDVGKYCSVLDYLYCEMGIESWEQRQEVYVKNFIRNGYLFHVTSSKNEDNILKKGLLTPTSLGKDVLSSKNLYEYSVCLNNKYDSYFPILKVNSYFNKNQESLRYDSIYFGFELYYLLNTYGNSSELSKFIEMKLENFFEIDFGNLNKVEKMFLLRNKLISDSILTEQEVDVVLKLLDSYIECSDNSKDIILFPYSKLNTSSKFVNKSKKNNCYDGFERSVFINSSFYRGKGNNLGCREIFNIGDIDPKDLILITTEQCPKIKSLQL